MWDAERGDEARKGWEEDMMNEDYKVRRFERL